MSASTSSERASRLEKVRSSATADELIALPKIIPNIPTTTRASYHSSGFTMSSTTRKTIVNEVISKETKSCKVIPEGQLLIRPRAICVALSTMINMIRSTISQLWLSNTQPSTKPNAISWTNARRVEIAMSFSRPIALR